MPRRRRQRERETEAKGLDQQNNNSALGAHFSVHFFAVTAWLRCESIALFHVLSRSLTGKGRPFFP